MWSMEPVRNKSTLDLVLITEDEIVEDVSFDQELKNSDHKMVCFTFNVTDLTTGSRHILKLSFQRTNFQALHSALRQFEELTGSDVEA